MISSIDPTYTRVSVRKDRTLDELVRAEIGWSDLASSLRDRMARVPHLCLGFSKEANKTVAYGGNFGKRKRAQLQQRPRLPVPTLEGLVRRQGFIKHRIRELQSPCFKPQTRQV